MFVLADHGIHVASACGGRGTCGQCRVLIEESPPPPTPVDLDRLGPLIKKGWRLACQLPVKRPLKVRVPEEALGAKTWIATVRSNRHLTPLIKELLLDLPPEPELTFRAGQDMLLEAETREIDFHELEIDLEFRDDWTRFDWWRYEVVIDEPTQRAYSLANAPAEGKIAMFNVRLALPPPKSEAPEGLLLPLVAQERRSREADRPFRGVLCPRP